MIYSEGQKWCIQFRFQGLIKTGGFLVKTVRVGCVQIEIKMKENKKKNSLKHWATGLRS